MTDTNNTNTSVDVNLDTEFASESVQQIDENARLIFVKQILISLGIFCFLIFGAYIFMPTNEALKGIFELVKIGVFPLVTLVIAFYFPNSK